MAERFGRGGRLIAVADDPVAWSDARHVAVEFVHPVIVGKRALPALAVAPGRRRADRPPRRHGDLLRDGRGGGTSPAGSRGSALPTIGFGGTGAEWEFGPVTDDPLVAQEHAETMYHLLWEHVHVFFEHRGSASGGAGASSFLYPFLESGGGADLEPVLADVRESMRMKAEEVADLRAQTLEENRETLAAAADAALACGTHLSRWATAARRPTRWMPSPTCGRARPGGARPECGLGDPDGAGQRHRARGPVRAPGDRVRLTGRRGAVLLDQRRVGERPVRTGGGAAAEARDRCVRRLRRRPDPRRGPRRPRDRQPLAAHPTDPGGTGDGLARAAGDGCEAPPGRASRAWSRAWASGRTSTGWRRSCRWPARCCNDERGVVVEVEGAASGRVVPARLPGEAPPLARVERVLGRPS